MTYKRRRTKGGAANGQNGGNDDEKHFDPMKILEFIFKYLLPLFIVFVVVMTIVKLFTGPLWKAIGNLLGDAADVFDKVAVVTGQLLTQCFMDQNGHPKNITLLGAMNPFTTQGCLIGQGVLLIGSYKFFGWALPKMWGRLAAGSKALLGKFSQKLESDSAFEFKGAETTFKEIGADGAETTYNVSEVLAQRIRSKAMAQLGDAPDIARVGLNSTIKIEENGKIVDVLQKNVDTWMETHFVDANAEGAMSAADMINFMTGLLKEGGEGGVDIIGGMSSNISRKIAENAKNAEMDGAEELVNKLSTADAAKAAEAAQTALENLGGEATSAAGQAADAFAKIIMDFA
jgi:hypothetical protein